MKLLCALGFHRDLKIIGFVEGDLGHGMFRCDNCTRLVQKIEGLGWLGQKTLSKNKTYAYLREHNKEKFDRELN